MALERHKENGEPWTDFSTTGECSWAGVLDEMSRAEEEYFANGRGSKNIVRKAFRRAGDYAPAISPWFDLIPDDDGMNVLSAGLKLVFNVRRERGDSRPPGV